MRQIVQNVRTGKLSVLEVPDPLARPGQVLIANVASVISAGTEKMVLDMAKKSLVGKARERPDLVRKVLLKMRTEGVLDTVKRVFQQFDEPLKLGYSSSGVVLACGAGVQAYRPGDRVASNGAHAGVVSVPLHLTARVPDAVSHEHAAFGVIGAIALQGVRLSRTALGETVLVVGLGLVGQVAVALLRASGCRVIGTDLDAAKCALAVRMGADSARPGLGAKDVLEATRGIGADAVLVTAATKSSAPVELAAEAVRAKGRIVVVGSVGLELDRRPLFLKEAELVVSCSYGPGRYDPEYEDRGHDYPVGHVRWTEQRNLQAVLDLMGSGGLDVGPLVTHRFPVETAEKAYAMMEAGTEPYLGIVLAYPEGEARRTARRVSLPAGASAADAARGTTALSGTGFACLGAGSFARAVLLPALQGTRLAPRLLCSAGGVSAVHQGEKLGFAAATADEEEVFRDPEVRTVFVLTRHGEHARQTVRALESGKHVFVEKPLALSIEEVDAIEQALAGASNADAGACASRPLTSPLLMVGFNRRFAPFAVAARAHFAKVDSPLTIAIRFNPGEIPKEHWTQDELEGGGRIVGEACHAIDLATYLAGAPPVRVFAESIGGPNAPRVTDDQCFLTLRHANGAVSSIAYLAGGDKAFPKERVEVLGGGRVAVIDDWRTLETWAGGSVERKTAKQDKGHRAEVSLFAERVLAGGASPIPWSDLRAVTLASILAVRSLREGVPFEVPGDEPDSAHASPAESPTDLGPTR